MILILIVLFLSLTSAQNYEIKGAQVKYYGSHIFGDWIGISNDLNGSIFYDKNNSNHKAELQVALRSLDSRNSNRDSNMLTYTEALDFPEIKFKSIKIIMDGDAVKIEGELSFHGVTNTINSIAKINILDGLEVDGTFLINLNDYNIDPPTLMFIRIDDIIKIEYSISAN